MKKHLIPAVLATVSLTASAAEPLFMRFPAISPDGSTIAFSYKGTLYTVPSQGGDAKALTSGASYNAQPYWSPDGTRLAFASDRNGSLDVFVMPAQGGTPHRLTTDSGRETPTGWLNDSTVIFSASDMPGQQAIQAQYMPQTYTVNANNPGRPVQLYSVAMPKLSVNPVDGSLLYHDKKGFENAFRKHERSSGTSDIWLVRDGKFTRLTTFNGHDLNPLWAGKDSLVYISEADGTLNVHTMKTDGSAKRQLTSFDRNPVRDLSRAQNGTLAFSQNGLLYTLAPGAAEPVQIRVNIAGDDYDADLVRGLRTSGARNTAVSNDGKQIALNIRGDIYVTADKYKTTRRITNTPGQERVMSFAPDGRTLYYDSERDGQWAIYSAMVAKEPDATMPYATEVTETAVYVPAPTHQAQQPSVSPDGKMLAFLEDRTTLKVMDLKSHKTWTALDGKYNYSYSDGDVPFVWSPDSKWLLISYIGEGGWNNTDIALVKADGIQTIDLTQSGYSDYNPRWALDGRALVYGTGRYGKRSHGSWGEEGDVVFMALDGEAWDLINRTQEEADLEAQAKEKEQDGESEKEIEKQEAKEKEQTSRRPFDLDGRRYRTRRLTGTSSNLVDFVLSPDGSTLYYIAGAIDGKYNLYKRDLRKGDTNLLAADLYGSIDTDEKVDNLYISTSTGIKKVAVADGKVTPIEYEADYDRHPSLERAYIYDHMLAQVRDKFHDTTLHGTDWTYYADNYRRYLPHINNNHDMADMLSEILGELNASHTGSGYRGNGPDMTTAVLGAYYDPHYAGPGLRIAEILKRGPLDTAAANLAPGDIITAIDGTQIEADTDINPLLDGKNGRKVQLRVRRNRGRDKEAAVTVRPISRGQQNELLYQRWVERNAAIVDSLSDGRLGYVHVQGMDSPSFRQVYSELLGKYRNRLGAVVDTRYNGGGWLHNDIALLLSGHEYVRYTPRGQYIGSDPFSQWTKPSVMLVNEANYSDAHGTPYVYQTLGIGPVIGAPVPGTMTAVWWETQIDPTIYFGIPQVTSLDTTGQPLENKQLNPDIPVYTNPGDIIQGSDAQLKAAVDHLLKTIDQTPVK